MRQYITLIGLLFVVAANAQIYIEPRSIQVTSNKTTNIIFPAQISSIDRGSERIVVQKSTGNILRVKADTSFTDTTNLTVITSDGKLYSFLVSYAHSPPFLNINLSTADNLYQDTALISMASEVLQMKGNLYGYHYSSGKVKVSMKGVYVKDDLLIFKLRVENHSSLSFELGAVSVFVRADGGTKRRPMQEMNVSPLLVHAPLAIIKDMQSSNLAIVLPKVAVDTKFKVRLEILEKGGERNLTLNLSNKYLLKAKLIQSK